MNKPTQKETKVEDTERKVHKAIALELGRRYTKNRMRFEDDCHIGGEPRFSKSGDAFLLLWDSMKELGWSFVLQSTKSGVVIGLIGDEGSFTGYGDTLPLALMNAAAQALGVDHDPRKALA